MKTKPKAFNVETETGEFFLILGVDIGQILRYCETREMKVRGVMELSHYKRVIDLTKGDEG